MNRLFLIAGLAAVAFAQDAKMAKETAPAPAPNERVMTETEVLRLQNTILQVQVLQTKFKLEEYQKEVQPIVAEQASIRTKACESLGVPAAKIDTECGITGLDGSGKILSGPDGKPMPVKVFWNRPIEQKAAGTK